MKYLFLFLSSSILFIACNPQKSTSLEDSTRIDWIYQVDSLLMPYWMTDVAIGTPPGNFPNYRNNDGNLAGYSNFDFSLVPKEWRGFIIEQTDSLRRNFLRVKSRQIFAYCVAYHLTGTEAYLKNAKLGVDYLLKNGAFDTGLPVTFWQDGEGQPDESQRTAQDLAYSLTGLTMYYYLTRDKSILEPILKVKERIFLDYFENSSVSESTKIFQWVKEDFESESSSSRLLIASLDQLNAYLLMLTPITDQTTRETLETDIREVCRSLMTNFYSKSLNMFWADLDDKSPAQFQTDFGHSIKTFWMIYMAGIQLNDQEFISFAKEGAEKLLQIAYRNDTGSWSYKYVDSTLLIDKSSSWWVYAELDQMTATLSLKDTSYYSGKETWLALDENGQPFDNLSKALHWKNGYHSLEHALIGHLSTANYFGEDVSLYYAFSKMNQPDSSRINPYYYPGDISSISKEEFDSEIFSDLEKTKIVFENIH
jgi:mannose/cellobiose epimerase-like protein (N-acyl-D-glucosamine 2-epimerase family)